MSKDESLPTIGYLLSWENASSKPLLATITDIGQQGEVQLGTLKLPFYGCAGASQTLWFSSLIAVYSSNNNDFTRSIYWGIGRYLFLAHFNLTTAL